MSLLYQINGDLFRELSGATSTSRSASTVNGKGSSATFASTADVSVGIGKAATAFANSFQRLGGIVGDVLRAHSRVQEVSQAVDDLLKLAENAAQPGKTEGERGRLHSQFVEGVQKFRALRDGLEAIGNDGEVIELLETGGMTTLLRQAGIDPLGVNTVAESLRRLGGTDGEIGFENVLSEDVMVVTTSGVEFVDAPDGRSDPLLQNLQTEAGAVRAVSDLRKLQRSVHEDGERMQAIAEGVTGAVNFSYGAKEIFSSYAQASGSAEVLAEKIVGELRTFLPSNALGAYTDLDRELARELVGG